MDGIMTRRRSNDIRWDNLEITKEVDFLKGYLLSEIQVEFAIQLYKVHHRSPSPLEFIEAYKVILNRADSIKRAIEEKIN